MRRASNLFVSMLTLFWSSHFACPQIDEPAPPYLHQTDWMLEQNPWRNSQFQVPWDDHRPARISKRHFQLLGKTKITNEIVVPKIYSTRVYFQILVSTFHNQSSHFPLNSQEWSISNFPCSLTRNITPHTVKNMAFHSLSDERWLHYQFSLPHFDISL